jgi:hypothetical protein
MYWGSGTLSVLVGVVGGVTFVCAFLLGRRLGLRRSVGTAGVGLLLIGLSLSGVVDAVARMTFNPMAWLGVGLGVVGFFLLSWSGFMPRRRAVEKGSAAQVEVKKPSAPAIDDDMAEIEEILRRRGIS